MSDRKLTYSYGNRQGEDEYTAEKFTDHVGYLCGKLNTDFGTEFNACFLNRYENEHNHLGWHADDFAGMRVDQPIAVLSIGAEREIWIKEKYTKGEIPANQRILLENYSLFIMPVGFQDVYLHRIPKHSRPCGWRISLTFRSFN